MSSSEAVMRSVSDVAQAAAERHERPQLQLVRKVEVDLKGAGGLAQPAAKN